MENIKRKLSNREIQWLQDNYPDLYYDDERNIVCGELFFRMYYSDSEEDSYVINPDSSYEHKGGIIIEDSYEIEIDLSQHRLVPPVKEIGGKIHRVKEKWNIPNLGDLHVNSDKTLCLCAKTEEHTKMPKSFNLPDFFLNLLIPFFYYQSYYDKYGEEPWRAYSHAELGVLESYLNFNEPPSRDIMLFFLNNISQNTKDLIVKNVRLKGHHSCICDSKKFFRRCHKKVLLGYNNLRCDYHNLQRL